MVSLLQSFGDINSIDPGIIPTFAEGEQTFTETTEAGTPSISAKVTENVWTTLSTSSFATATATVEGAVLSTEAEIHDTTVTPSLAATLSDSAPAQTVETSPAIIATATMLSDAEILSRRIATVGNLNGNSGSVNPSSSNDVSIEQQLSQQREATVPSTTNFRSEANTQSAASAVPDVSAISPVFNTNSTFLENAGNVSQVFDSNISPERNNAQSSGGSSKALSSGAVAGIVIGTLVAVVIVAGLTFVALRRRKLGSIESGRLKKPAEQGSRYDKQPGGPSNRSKAGAISYLKRASINNAVRSQNVAGIRELDSGRFNTPYAAVDRVLAMRSGMPVQEFSLPILPNTIVMSRDSLKPLPSLPQSSLPHITYQQPHSYPQEPLTAPKSELCYPQPLTAIDRDSKHRKAKSMAPSIITVSSSAYSDNRMQTLKGSPSMYSTTSKVPLVDIANSQGLQTPETKPLDLESENVEPDRRTLYSMVMVGQSGRNRGSVNSDDGDERLSIKSVVG